MSLTEENNADFSEVSESNYNRVYNTVSKVGYSDGITDGRDSVFQKGFDCGYEDGLLIGFELAKYKAFFNVASQQRTATDIQAESAIYSSLGIPDAKDKSHFKILSTPDRKITEISNQQKDYVCKQQDVFAKELPIVSNLLSQ